MTGPEHYAEAEKLLDDASQTPSVELAMRWTAQAQVHATLAQVAATVAASRPAPRSVWNRGDDL